MLTEEMELDVLYKRAVDKFGYIHQICKAIEELGELSRALAKYVGMNSTIGLIARYGDTTSEYYHDRDEVIANIREEMADVCIVCNQLEIMFGHDAEVSLRKLEKLRRLVDGAG